MRLGLNLNSKQLKGILWGTSWLVTIRKHLDVTFPVWGPITVVGAQWWLPSGSRTGEGHVLIFSILVKDIFSWTSRQMVLTSISLIIIIDIVDRYRWYCKNFHHHDNPLGQQISAAPHSSHSDPLSLHHLHLHPIDHHYQSQFCITTIIILWV